VRGLTLKKIHLLCGILLLPNPTLAQESKSSDAVIVKAEHSRIGLGGEKAEHDTHPDA